MTTTRAGRIPWPLLLSCTLAASPAWAAICRVTPAGSVFNDGSSWATPATLKQALNVPATCTEVWASEGVYKPGAAGAGAESFVIADGAKVYGGFAGTETAREQRNPSLNLTVLSGDIDNNDTAVAGVVQDASGISGSNSRNVVTIAGVGPGTVLDGFVITAGNGETGGGLFCNGLFAPCNPMLSNLVFSGNAALVTGSAQNGGAIYIVNGSPVMRDVVFRGNRAKNGGALCMGSPSRPSLTRVAFEGNTAVDSGGAILMTATNGGSELSLSDVRFIGNRAGMDGGGIAIQSADSGSANARLNGVAFIENTAGRNGGGLANLAISGASASPVLVNVTFSGNEGLSKGGAIYNSSSSANAASSPTLTNVTLTANRVGVSGFGGGMYSESVSGSTSAPVLHNAVFWGNLAPLGQGSEIAAFGGATATFDHSIVKGSGGSAAWNPAFGVNAGSNLDVDPRLGGLSNSIGFTPSISPGAGSPAIDAGSACPAVDQRGVVRPQGAQCDIGAVEFFSIDLITHNGFDDCWSPVLTRSAFLQRIQTAIDGRTVCVPQYASTILGSPVTGCNTAACPGGAVGCPITLAVSTFDDGGNFRAGIFTAPGTASNVVIPVTTQFRNCVFNATGIQTADLVEYALPRDGNDGAYAALLNRISITATQYSISSTDSTCNGFADNVGPAFVNQASVALAAALRPPLEAVTLRESVCPLQ